MDERIIKVSKHLISKNMFYLSKNLYEKSNDLDFIIENFYRDKITLNHTSGKDFIGYKDYTEFVIHNINCIIQSNAIEMLENIFILKKVSFQNYFSLDKEFTNFYYDTNKKLILVN